ncbi:MAG TPA: hypothetical protein VMI31_13935 [Fimbriimonadaceae bacterium]|nr:hypothetical protein [Fimbriimonadaceae bacterium]
MKLKLLSILFTMALALFAIGQHGPAKHKVDDSADALRYGTYLLNPSPEMSKAIHLTSAQAKQMKAINAKFDVKMRAAFQSGSAHDMEGLRPIFEGRWKALYAVLNAKQKPSLADWAKHHPLSSRGGQKST